MINYPTTIAIDGPAASGKTTVGLMLARHIDYLFLDTGCMYRAVTLAALDQGFSVEDEISITNLTQGLDMDILPVRTDSDGRHYTVLLDGIDVTWDLRKVEVDMNVSQVSTYAGVRVDLVRRQRAIGERGQVVMVGRDIGTVVMPLAPLKLYVTASPEERARRRWKELEGRFRDATIEQILAEIERRDQIDGSREHSPMKPAADAIIVDTTNRTPEQVVQDILQLEPFQQVA
ncbi:MAG TPA: (d)CMP kinase [candidate division Zixibacteria bacterium]|nr:(d)CMP kinase [candidate division Zixibacteria bacterium]